MRFRIKSLPELQQEFGHNRVEVNNDSDIVSVDDGKYTLTIPRRFLSERFKGCKTISGDYKAEPCNKTFLSEFVVEIQDEPEENPQPSSANEVQVGGTHYHKGSIQPWDYIIDQNLGYLEGNVVKYVSRYKNKNGLEDLKKARHYLDKLIETEEAKKCPIVMPKS